MDPNPNAKMSGGLAIGIFTTDFASWVLLVGLTVSLIKNFYFVPPKDKNTTIPLKIRNLVTAFFLIDIIYMTVLWQFTSVAFPNDDQIYKPGHCRILMTISSLTNTAHQALLFIIYITRLQSVFENSVITIPQRFLNGSKMFLIVFNASICFVYVLYAEAAIEASTTDNSYYWCWYEVKESRSNTWITLAFLLVGCVYVFYTYYVLGLFIYKLYQITHPLLDSNQTAAVKQRLQATQKVMIKNTVIVSISLASSLCILGGYTFWFGFAFFFPFDYLIVCTGIYCQFPFGKTLYKYTFKIFENCLCHAKCCGKKFGIQNNDGLISMMSIEIRSASPTLSNYPSFVLNTSTSPHHTNPSITTENANGNKNTLTITNINKNNNNNNIDNSANNSNGNNNDNHDTNDHSKISDPSKQENSTHSI